MLTTRRIALVAALSFCAAGAACSSDSLSGDSGVVDADAAQSDAGAREGGAREGGAAETGVGDGATAEGGAGDGPGAEGGSGDGGGPGAKLHTLQKCQGLGPGTEDCHLKLLVDPSKCSSANPCTKLVVYWAGGEGSCYTGVYDKLLQSYANANFVAACAQPFTTGKESGAYPYYREFSRMDAIMKYIRQLPAVKAAWTGEKLMIGGVSHGASAPIMAIAHENALKVHETTWTGSKVTAVVAYDGISNTATLEQWAGTQQGCGTWHARWVGRYGDGVPLLHSCTNNKCYCSNPKSKKDWDADNVQIGVTGATYTCGNFAPKLGKRVLYRFVSCSGGTAKPCGLLGDIIPDDQQKLAHDGLAKCVLNLNMKSSYKQYPNCAHSSCGGLLCGFTDTLIWLGLNGF